MLSRCRLFAIRYFKTWHEYQAEQLGVDSATLQKLKDERPKGPYEDWKNQSISEQRISFILDHVPAAEQSGFLKEFATDDLASYVRKHLREFDDETLKKLGNIKIQHHALPGIDALKRFNFNLKKGGILVNEEIPAQSKLAQIAKLALQEKLKEVAWKKQDAEVSGRAVAKV